MTTNPPGNDAGTPIHDATAAADGFRDTPPVDTPPVDTPPLDALPLDEQLPATPSAAGAAAPVTTAGGTDSGAGSTGSGSPSTGAGSSDGGGKADAAKDAAHDVAGDAKAKASDVAGTAKEQAANVASEATDHAKQLYAQATDTLKEQAAGQQERAAGGLRSLGEQLGRMADRDDEQGIAAKVVRDLSHRAGSAAGYLEGRDPGSLLSEVKSFAAKRPGTFIALAAGAGILAGRLTKALAAETKHEHEHEHEADGTTGATSAPRAPGVPGATAADGTAGTA